MAESRILILFGVAILAGASVWFITQIRLSNGLPSTSLLTPDGNPPVGVVSTSSPEITYTADGKLDTSDWQEYRSEYGGFSVRAPKDSVSIHDESLNYFFLRLNRIGAVYEEELLGLSIQTIQKTSSSTLDTWLDMHVVPGVYKDIISNIRKTSVDGFPALQFDRQRQNISSKDKRFDETTKISVVTFPSGIVYNNVPTLLSSDSSRYFVIDLGNRYALVRYTLPPYFFSKEYMRLDDETLSKIYDAILDSFQAFTPTKL